ncbi:hypothetical protein HPB50_016117 [Hyalomma asiaticum]|uniref:Uncharacterized protein n=1 Tax=Hyalomma asiaticum TaxID=266040 RepID=A0ACB7SWS2_HYAAI|nr:hypothetical protein HPB50_016117 [Hyalomma asiaticum]
MYEHVRVIQMAFYVPASPGRDSMLNGRKPIPQAEDVQLSVLATTMLLSFLSVGCSEETRSREKHTMHTRAQGTGCLTEGSEPQTIRTRRIEHGDAVTLYCLRRGFSPRVRGEEEEAAVQPRETRHP